LPSCVIVVACLQDGRREHWQALYYNRVWEKLPTFACAKGLIIDTLSVISSVIAIYRLYSGQSVSISGLNSGLWSYPSLPGTIFGIWLWVASRMRMTGNQAILGGFLIVILIAVSIALVVHFSLSQIIVFGLHRPYHPHLWRCQSALGSTLVLLAVVLAALTRV